MRPRRYALRRDASQRDDCIPKPMSSASRDDRPPPSTGTTLRPQVRASGIPTWIGVGGSPESVTRAHCQSLPLMMAIIGGSSQRFTGNVRLAAKRRAVVEVVSTSILSTASRKQRQSSRPGRRESLRRVLEHTKITCCLKRINIGPIGAFLWQRRWDLKPRQAQASRLPPAWTLDSFQLRFHPIRREPCDSRRMSPLCCYKPQPSGH